MVSYQDWHIPYHHDTLTLQNALASLQAATSLKSEPPLMLAWIETLYAQGNGIDIFQGAIDKEQYEYIHIALGRGLLKMDEIFTFGFTLGSVKKGVMTEQSLNAYILKHLQPILATLDEQELVALKEAVKLSAISSCMALDRFAFGDWLDLPLRVLRDAIGLEYELITAYYAVEQRRYPKNKASQRLNKCSEFLSTYASRVWW